MVSTFRKEEPVTTNVHDAIRSELKKIVQMQHDTVMNFLNTGSQGMNTAPSNFQGMNQQLGAILKQQQSSQSGEPLEFVIETKVKTIDSTGKVTYTDIHNQQNLPVNKKQAQPEQNYFMKIFEDQRSTTPRQSAKSSFIKIPLLNSQYGRERSASPVRFPSIKNQRSTGNFALLDFCSNKNHGLTEAANQLVFENVKESVKKTPMNYKNFQLLKLNYNGNSTPRLVIFILQTYLKE